MLTKNTAQLRSVVAEHIAQDAIVQGFYWDEEANRGCFIGCLAHDNNPELNEQQYGLPVMLQRIAENIFEALSAADAKEFFNALPDAVGCDGKDLTKVGWQFLASELRALPQQEADIQAGIDSVIAGMDRLAAGQEWREVSAAAWAAEAAYVNAVEAAAWSAKAARAAARAATWAVEAAAWSAKAARAAARTAANAAAKAAANAANAANTAEAARAAAGAAEWVVAAKTARCRQRDLLLRLITEAPVVGHLHRPGHHGLHRAARRPKLKSLAEDAREAVQRMWEGSPDVGDWGLIRRALERLQELEGQNAN